MNMPLLAPATEIKSLKISSAAFASKEKIPIQYTCDGLDINPPLKIDAIRTDTTSVAIILEDPDAPLHTWTHWLIWNLPANSVIEEGTRKGICGMNDFKKSSYSGPCPMKGTHRYVWKVFTLNTLIKLKKGASRKELEDAMTGQITGYGELIGLYK